MGAKSEFVMSKVCECYSSVVFLSQTFIFDGCVWYR